MKKLGSDVSRQWQEAHRLRTVEVPLLSDPLEGCDPFYGRPPLPQPLSYVSVLSGNIPTRRDVFH